jgi:hypothetical protein
METQSALTILEQINWPKLIFKIVAFLLSFGYFGYSLIYQQQIIKMKKNTLIYYHLLEKPNSNEPPPQPLLFSFSLLQLFIGVFMVVMSLFFL